MAKAMFTLGKRAAAIRAVKVWILRRGGYRRVRKVFHVMWRERRLMALRRKWGV